MKNEALVYGIFGALVGAVLGSFLAATFYRAKRGISLTTPSTCPKCGKAIPPWRNIPVVTWILQRGRAACCDQKVSPAYLGWEGGSALIGALLGAVTGLVGIIVAAVVALLGGILWWARCKRRLGSQG